MMIIIFNITQVLDNLTTRNTKSEAKIENKIKTALMKKKR